MEEILRIAEQEGIDVEELVFNAIRGKVNDPAVTIRLRVELAERYLSESEDYLRRGDAAQASEKAYKAAEEIIKALAEKLNTREHQQAIKEGRWYTYWLSAVASIYDWSRRGWSSAYLLHVWGFHKGKLDAATVSSYIRDVKEMLIKAKEELGIT